MWIFVTAKGQRLVVAELPAVLGSSQEADVVVPHESVAARHAQLSQGPDGGLLVDAIDGADLEVGGWEVAQTGLMSGDEILIGRIRFTVELVDESTGERTEPEGRAPPRETAPEPKPVRAGPLAPAGGKARRPPAAAGGKRPSAGQRSGQAAAAAPRRDELQQRQRGILVTAKNERDGWLHTDLSSLTGGAKLVVAAALLAVAGGLWWVIQFAVASAL